LRSRTGEGGQNTKLDMGRSSNEKTWHEITRGLESSKVLPKAHVEATATRKRCVDGDAETVPVLDSNSRGEVPPTLLWLSPSGPQS